MRSVFSRIVSKIGRLCFATRYRSCFKKLGAASYLYGPFRIDGAANIEIGSGSVLQRGAWLYCKGIDDKPASMRIGKGCVFGYNNHITAVRDVTIGDHVLTANNVYISDNLHGYEDIVKPIIDQPVRFKGSVVIGDGCWIGENACIIGVRVGRNCVVGANAVVTRDVPDYSVVVGVPAYLTKRFDPATRQWVCVPKPEESTE